MSHTPGPWNLTGASFGYSIGANGIRIAQTADIVHPGSVGVHEEEANARLISAAPDLLEMCRNGVLWIEAGEHKLKEDEKELLARFRAAVAKAEGKKEVAV